MDVFIPFVSKEIVEMEVPSMPSVVGGRGPLLGRFSEPRGQATTLAVIADPHISPTADGTWKLYHRMEARLQAAIADINRLAVDVAIIVGDLTRDGRSCEFDRLVDSSPVWSV